MSTPAAPASATLARGLSTAAVLGFVCRRRWILGAVALLVLALLVVHWARVRPGYDPYGWLVWGHLTLHGKLDTNGAPSWKPLPYLFTVPFALAGKHALTLWMTTAVAISLAGVVFAWRVAFVLVDAAPERRYAAYVAGLVAAVAVCAIDTYPHSVLSAESDTVIVTLCLAAVDCILARRYRWAWWLWWLAALGRPEAWAPMAVYIVWAWRSEPAMRRQIVAGLILIAVLWFGIPAISSKSAFSAGSLAENSPRMIHGNKITGTWGRFSALNAASVKLAALIAVILAGVRRDRAVLLLAGGVLLWVLVEVAFALHGWPAVPRYLYEAAGGTCVLAGVFAGRLILDAPAVFAALAARLRGSGRTRPRWAWLASPSLAGAAATLVLAGFAAAAVPVAHQRLNDERTDLAAQRARTHEILLLAQVLTHLGVAKIEACGHPDIPIAFQSILAWDLGTNTGWLYFSRKHEREHPHPIVNLYPHSYGWQVFPSDTTPARQAACTGLTYSTS
jgi:hypothetical protein